MADEDHLAILKKGVGTWNNWREENPSIQPDLSSADLKGANLSRANLNIAYLSRADLFRADLSSADLKGANLHRVNLSRADLSEANLSRADLSEANLSRANLSEANLNIADLDRADLFRADLSRANLSRANLSEATIIRANMRGAIITDCRVFGISAWGLIGLEEAEQKNLTITPFDEPKITVDNLEVAQFIYLMLHSEKIRDVINTIGQKGVLILGRFGERKAVLEAIRAQLRSMGYVPFVFDFERPTNRDFTETVMTLAGMSRFIIAEITQPKSVPLELKTIVPNYMIPMVTIIEKGEKPFSMFQDLWIQYKDYVLEPLSYDSIEQLQRVFKEAIVDPANQRLESLRKQKAEEMCIRYAKDYEEKKSC